MRGAGWTRGARSRFAVGELTGALVGGQRGDDLVEVAGQDVGQLVDREADAVIGDPVLLEVVGPDLLAAPPAADLSPPLDGRGDRPRVCAG